jgi:hypothetical protein
MPDRYAIVLRKAGQTEVALGETQETVIVPTFMRQTGLVLSELFRKVPFPSGSCENLPPGSD